MSSDITDGAISYGWTVMKRDVIFYAGITFFAIAISIFVSGMAEIMKPDGEIFFAILNSAISFFIELGFAIVFLNSVMDGQTPSITDFCVEVPLYFNFILASILYSLIIMVGTLLLIVPGIIWGIKYGFYPYAMIDEGLGPIEALKRSGQITEGAKWDIFIFGFFVGLVNILGALALGFGLLLTIPTTGIAYAYVYCVLVGRAEIGSSPADGEPVRQNVNVPVMSARKR